MRIPENLDHSKKHWDRYKAFAWDMGGPQVTLFDTGELIVTQCYSNVRRIYPEVGVEITCTGPGGITYARTPDGREVKQAWITQNGLQEALVDESSGYIVSLSDTFKQGDPRVPARFAPNKFGFVRTYIGGPGLPPVGAGQIEVCPPVNHKEWFTSEQREHLDDILCASKAAVAMRGETKNYGTMSVDISELLTKRDHTELTEMQQKFLAVKGLPRPKFLFDHLLVS